MEPIKVLHIEDDPFWVMLISEMAKRKSPGVFEFDTAGMLAGGIHRAKDYDVVLLDLNINGESHGLDTLREFREGVPDIPVIVMTGVDDDELMDATARLGAADCFVKASQDVNGKNQAYSREQLVRRLRFVAMARRGTGC